MEEVNAYFNEMHISDGLPIIPPTEEALRGDAGILPV